eukprot:GHVT01093388.1.p1 GENE.GHVT01093388.1~~GHVT01093388.1.p1  ORF type:complete len:1434 (+),score=173.53 GHVT01093388.1:1051-5352(+)
MSCNPIYKPPKASFLAHLWSLSPRSSEFKATTLCNSCSLGGSVRSETCTSMAPTTFAPAARSTSSPGSSLISSPTSVCVQCGYIIDHSPELMSTSSSCSQSAEWCICDHGEMSPQHRRETRRLCCNVHDHEMRQHPEIFGHRAHVFVDSPVTLTSQPHLQREGGVPLDQLKAFFWHNRRSMGVIKNTEYLCGRRIEKMPTAHKLDSAARQQSRPKSEPQPSGNFCGQSALPKPRHEAAAAQQPGSAARDPMRVISGMSSMPLTKARARGNTHGRSSQLQAVPRMAVDSVFYDEDQERDEEDDERADENEADFYQHDDVSEDAFINQRVHSQPNYQDGEDDDLSPDDGKTTADDRYPQTPNAAGGSRTPKSDRQDRNADPDPKDVSIYQLESCPFNASVIDSLFLPEDGRAIAFQRGAAPSAFRGEGINGMRASYVFSPFRRRTDRNTLLPLVRLPPGRRLPSSGNLAVSCYRGCVCVDDSGVRFGNWVNPRRPTFVETRDGGRPFSAFDVKRVQVIGPSKVKRGLVLILLLVEAIQNGSEMTFVMLLPGTRQGYEVASAIRSVAEFGETCRAGASKLQKMNLAAQTAINEFEILILKHGGGSMSRSQRRELVTKLIPHYAASQPSATVMSLSQQSATSLFGNYDIATDDPAGKECFSQPICNRCDMSARPEVKSNLAAVLRRMTFNSSKQMCSDLEKAIAYIPSSLSRHFATVPILEIAAKLSMDGSKYKTRRQTLNDRFAILYEFIQQVNLDIAGPVVDELIAEMPPAFRLIGSSCRLGKSEPMRDHCEDAVFFSEATSTFGVFDGVGSWSKFCLDPSNFSRGMAYASVTESKLLAEMIQDRNANDKDQLLRWIGEPARPKPKIKMTDLPNKDPFSAKDKKKTENKYLDVEPLMWAHSLLCNAHERISQDNPLAWGTSTAVIGTVSPYSGELSIANLGDSCLMVLRRKFLVNNFDGPNRFDSPESDGDSFAKFDPANFPWHILHVVAGGSHERPGAERSVVFQTEEQVWPENLAPFQLSLLPARSWPPTLWRKVRSSSYALYKQLLDTEADAPGLATPTLCNLQPGDLLLAMSDGITDNLFSSEIAKISSLFLSPVEARQLNDEALATSPEAIAEIMVGVARRRAFDSNMYSKDFRKCDEPTVGEGISEGLKLKGKKSDDLACVAVWIDTTPAEEIRNALAEYYTAVSQPSPKVAKFIALSKIRLAREAGIRKYHARPSDDEQLVPFSVTMKDPERKFAVELPGDLSPLQLPVRERHPSPDSEDPCKTPERNRVSDDYNTSPQVPSPPSPTTTPCKARRHSVAELTNNSDPLPLFPFNGPLHGTASELAPIDEEPRLAFANADSLENRGSGVQTQVPAFPGSLLGVASQPTTRIDLDEEDNESVDSEPQISTSRRPSGPFALSQNDAGSIGVQRRVKTLHIDRAQPYCGRTR